MSVFGIGPRVGASEVCVLGMNSLLDARVQAHHLLIQIRVFAHQDLGIPRHSRKDGLNAAAHGCHKDLADLQTNNERKSHNDSGEVALGVITRVSELQVQVRQQRAKI